MQQQALQINVFFVLHSKSGAHFNSNLAQTFTTLLLVNIIYLFGRK